MDTMQFASKSFISGDDLFQAMNRVILENPSYSMNLGGIPEGSEIWVINGLTQQTDCIVEDITDTKEVKESNRPEEEAFNAEYKTKNPFPGAFYYAISYREGNLIEPFIEELLKDYPDILICYPSEHKFHRV